MKYWLMKSEPNAFSLEDLKNAKNGTECWDGIRNYQARNFMRDDMKIADRVLFYHSVINPSVVGTAKVVKEVYPDYTAWDPESTYFEPKITPEIQPPNAIPMTVSIITIPTRSPASCGGIYSLTIIA